MKAYSIFIIIFLLGSVMVTSQNLLNSESSVDQRGVDDRFVETGRTADSMGLFVIRRNAVYNLDILLICYERIFPIKKKFGLRVTGGVLIWDPFNLVGEFGGLVGGPVHFAEAGIGYNLNPFDSEWNMALYRFGYRLQLKKGFMAKVSAAYVNKPIGSFLPFLGVGYAF